MRRALAQAGKLTYHDSPVAQASIPIFLCPVLLKAPVRPTISPARTTRSSRPISISSHARQQATTTDQHRNDSQAALLLADTTPNQALPRSCPGCGAPTQVFDKKEAGYYNIDRRGVKGYLEFDPAKGGDVTVESDVYTRALKQADPKLLEALGLDRDVLDAPQHPTKAAPQIPTCDRCHNLVNHNIATPISHPTIAAIQETIAESPHRRNHIYHVVDAADFPLSLVPYLQSSLRIPKLRTQNRRAKHKGWVANDRIAEVSFIVTRSDLLAPEKEQVDRLMPYFQNVLRDALGRTNQNARLGNIRLVSAKRGWWTKQVKDEIWDRGGAGWMVGKVNVGKSNLFEMVFPKGRGADFENIRQIRSAAEREAMLENTKSVAELVQVQKQLAEEDVEAERQNSRPRSHIHEPPPEEPEEEDFDPDSLLPPVQVYTPYPVFPIASSLPGTTASPIRIPFGRNRGELVDLPGLARTSPGLETFVEPAHHDDLVMEHRITAERHILKPGQSLLLGGGLIRLTPVTPDLVFLVHPFVPLPPHTTATDKATALQTQTSDRHVPSILAPHAGAAMKSAGRFQLQWDATKKLAGPLTDPTAGKMKPENLPFQIWSADILVEGVGWLEVSAQVRRPQGWRAPGMVKKDPNHARHAKREVRAREDLARARKFDALGDAGSGEQDAFDREVAGRRNAEDGAAWGEFPEIEVFSPLGKFVGVRRPMCASVVSGPRVVSSRERAARPRRSMVSVKRQRKPKERG
ncbi:hypothetical protein BDV95DRAFT_584841 [Massariosphaeria phaeospora]|uniref:Genetic interactor of prohibitins 3, mitochondrial n=1 Tax=Massariosphaeria phaeospora TaxID=100035 RepID=A0A7C8HZC4_9PLEO|nr:hypothetical protein BDV95DRAFT_584841 [Massariosphaeria phaeospora]